jgi:hypothetical protein
MAPRRVGALVEAVGTASPSGTKATLVVDRPALLAFGH